MVKPILGIIGGGQLGSMLANAAKKINVKTVIKCKQYIVRYGPLVY